MVEFKLVIGNPKDGKCYQVAISGENAETLLGKKIGDNIKGESFDMTGYEFVITGGADYCGFPMRRDIEGAIRKKVFMVRGIGTRNTENGVRIRKTVCGNTIHDNISQVSLKVVKQGKKPLGEPEAPVEETPAEKPAEKPKKEKKVKEAPKEEAPKEEAPKEEAPKEEAPKEEAPKEEKVEDKKE